MCQCRVCNEEATHCLRLAEVREHRVDQLKGLVDFLTDFGTGEDDLSRNEDQEHLSQVSQCQDDAHDQSVSRSWASSFCR